MRSRCALPGARDPRQKFADAIDPRSHGVDPARQAGGGVNHAVPHDVLGVDAGGPGARDEALGIGAQRIELARRDLRGGEAIACAKAVPSEIVGHAATPTPMALMRSRRDAMVSILRLSRHDNAEQSRQHTAREGRTELGLHYGTFHRRSSCDPSVKVK